MDIKKISSNELKDTLDKQLDRLNEPLIITRQGVSQGVLIDYDTFSNLMSINTTLFPLLTQSTQQQDCSYLKSLPGMITQTASRISNLENDYLNLLLSIANALDTNQSYLYGHNERIAIFSCEVARQMGCTEEEIEHIRLASILHNIGEITIPAFVLQKKAELEPEDWELIKNHPRISAEIIGKIKYLEPVVPIVYSHHEKFDGSGYPDGIKGKAIPLGSRIISIADTYDAMTNVRLHRDTSNHFEAISEIKKLSGTSYDPEVVEIFTSLF